MTATAMLRRLPGTMPNGHLVSCVLKVLLSAGAVWLLCREAMRSMETRTLSSLQLPVDPDSSFEMPPCPTCLSSQLQQPLTMVLLLLSTDIFSAKHTVSREPREQNCWGERGWGPSIWHRLLQSALANPTTACLGHSSSAFPVSCSHPAPPLTAATS